MRYLGSFRTYGTVAGIVLGCLFFSNTAAAQEEFSWRFEEGESFLFVAEQRQRLDVGDAFSFHINWKAYYQWQVEGIESDAFGEYYVILLTLERAVCDSKAANEDSSTHYDTANDPAAEGRVEEIAEWLNPLIGSQLVMEMDLSGTIYTLEPTEESAELFEIVDSDIPIGPPGLVCLLQEGLVVLPEESLETGDSWTDYFEPLGFAEDTSADVLFRYRGKQPYGSSEASLIELSLVYAEEEEVGEDDPEILSFVEEGTGQIWYDHAAGRLLERSFKHVQEIVGSTSEGDRTITIATELELTLSPLEDE